MGYGVIGGGVIYSPGNGSATVFGLGLGVNTTKMKEQPGIDNIGGLSGGYTVDRGQTRLSW